MASPRKPTPLLPEQTVTSVALSAVATVMSYLASIALGVSLVISSATEGWIEQSASQATVQVVETPRLTADEQVPAVLAELKRWPQIAEARVLSDAELDALLAPWLGSDNLSDDLPIPVLIEITPLPQQSLPAQELRVRLAAVAPGARLNLHQRWRERARDAAQQLSWAIGVMLALIAVVTAIVVLFATRAGLSANHDILQILHLIGAQDDFIARRFEWRVFRLTSLASLVGYGAACGSLYAFLPMAPHLPQPMLFAWLALVPLAVVLCGWLMTRHYVMRALRQMT